MNYDNLKEKTVFDFTSDIIVLKKLFPEYTKDSKAAIIKMLLSDLIANGFYLWSFAELCNNSSMTHAIERQFDMSEIYGFDPD